MFRKVRVLSVAGCACDQERADFFYKHLLILYSHPSDEWLTEENSGPTFRRIMLPVAPLNRRSCVPRSVSDFVILSSSLILLCLICLLSSREKVLPVIFFFFVVGTLCCLYSTERHHLLFLVGLTAL